MMNWKLAMLSGAFLLAAACSQEEFDAGQNPGDDGLITISGEINQLMLTRANDSGFCDGDVMGVYIVDYNGTTPGTLQNSGNHAGNVRLTFDEEAGKWIPAYELTWRNNHTPIDVYGYYPYDANPGDVNAYRFSISTRQNDAPDGMSGYEASDFLWGKVAGAEPTTKIIRLSLDHKMACMRVSLVEGEGFADGEWVETPKQVIVANTVTDAVIDLAEGTVTPAAGAGVANILPLESNAEWRAIVLPQSLAAGTELLSITINGMPYKYTLQQEIALAAGKMNNFAIRVDKKGNEGDYQLTLVGESITPWENDPVSHDAVAREYVVVDVPQAGTLEKCITDAGYSLENIRNLKVTGHINNVDFKTMYCKLTSLVTLNLKDVRIAASSDIEWEIDGVTLYAPGGEADCIPDVAFSSSMQSGRYDRDMSLKSIVFPDVLKSIGANAFVTCPNLSGSLVLPEGLEKIGDYAFRRKSMLKGSLTLPSTLKEIGNGAFQECGFVCELKLPSGLESIGTSAFSLCMDLYGELNLPANLKSLGDEAFLECRRLTGSLVIPQGVKTIPKRCFYGPSLGGTLTLHDGVESIEERAFDCLGFKGELILPANLSYIGDNAFSSNKFSGTLKIPASVGAIGASAFSSNRFSGILEIPEGIYEIGDAAFWYCSDIDGVVLPASLDKIGSDAFKGCSGISSIVCKGTNPPSATNAFGGLAKDNFTVEVPESAVAAYQSAPGWSEFKRIVAHHELVCRPALACALSTERKQTLVIDAEGDWEVESMPDWCELSPRSGSGKTEVALTIKALSGADREGDVVFRLKDKDYTSGCHVSQYAYEYAEDEYLALQTATRGNNGGINIVILGDGYNAKEIASGKYLANMRQMIEYFFAVEPYTTYRDYFNVYTAFPLSAESGVNTVNTIRYNRFDTALLSSAEFQCDKDELINYVLEAPTVDGGNLNETLIIIVPNCDASAGYTDMWQSGLAVSFCPMSTDEYPYDARGVVQHEAGGHGFGKLGDESISHNSFIDACPVTLCPKDEPVKNAKRLGWFDNLELTGKIHQVGWSHLIFDPRYSDIVDIYEGGHNHSRGIYRSERTSCMYNQVPYFSTISRESIVKRIKLYAGETFDFEDFVARDNRNSGEDTKSVSLLPVASQGRMGMPPHIHSGNPLDRKARKRK